MSAATATGSEERLTVRTFSPPKSFTWPNTLERKFKRKDRMPSIMTRTVQKALFQNKEKKKKEQLTNLERKVNRKKN